MIKKDSCIAYKGLKYTIEWYFDKKSKSQVLEYYSALTPLERRKVLMLFKRMGEFGKINDKTKFRNEGDKLPKNEKTKAINYRIDYSFRTEKEIYYGK